MLKERSCGAVIYREIESGIEILLQRHKNGGHWAYAKGHVEGNETDEQTALREIREETGLVVELFTDFREVSTFSPKPGVMKDVVYFAAKAMPNAQTTPQEEEVLDIKWVSPDKAIEQLTYPADKEICKKFLSWFAAQQ